MIRLSDVVKEQGLTPDRLAGAMRYLQIYAAADLDKALERVAETAVLPTAIRLTPRKSGKLAGSLKVRTRIRKDVGRTEIYSNLPYANTIHWGRATLPTQRSPKEPKFTNKVVGKKFIERAALQNQGRIGDELLREVDKLIDKQVPRG